MPAIFRVERFKVETTPPEEKLITVNRNLYCTEES